MALWLLYFFPAVKEMYCGVVSWLTFPRQTQCSGHSHSLQRSWMCSGTPDAEPKPKGGLECCVALLTCPAGAFLLTFLGLISNYVKSKKLDGWCHKMPGAQLASGSGSSDNCCNFISSLSLSPKLRASVKHGEGRNYWEGGAKSEERRKNTGFGCLFAFLFPALQILMLLTCSIFIALPKCLFSKCICEHPAA